MRRHRLCRVRPYTVALALDYAVLTAATVAGGFAAVAIMGAAVVAVLRGLA